MAKNWGVKSENLKKWDPPYLKSAPESQVKICTCSFEAAYIKESIETFFKFSVLKVNLYGGLQRVTDSAKAPEIQYELSYSHAEVYWDMRK